MAFKASLKLPFYRVLGILAMLDSGETDWKVNQLISSKLVKCNNITGDSNGCRGGTGAKHLGHGESRDRGAGDGKSCSRLFQAL